MVSGLLIVKNARYEQIVDQIMNRICVSESKGTSRKQIQETYFQNHGKETVGMFRL